MKRFLGSMCLLLLIVNVGSSQTPFQNLDFETFIPNPVEPLFGELPGWGGASFIPHIGFDSLVVLTNDQVLAGTTSILLQTGFETVPGYGELVSPLAPEGAGISQTGFVPISSRSIRLLSSTAPVVDIAGEDSEFWSVTLGGSQIALTEISPGQWGGDFSPNLAGTTQTLSIDVIPRDGLVPNDVLTGLGTRGAFFDNISFSSETVSAVPEPCSTLVLVGGLLGLVSHRRKSSLRNVVS